MICLKCLRNNIDSNGLCPDCGFEIDLNRKNTNLTDMEYNQLDVIDMKKVFKEHGGLETVTLDTIGIQSIVYNEVFGNCNYSILAIFVGIHKIDTHLYPIFRYEVAGAVYFVEDINICANIFGTNTTYEIGKAYNVFIDFSRPFIMSTRSQNSVSSTTSVNAFKGGGLVSYLIKFFIILPFVFSIGVFVLFFVLNVYPLKTLGFDRVVYDGKYVDKVSCGEDFDEPDFCLGLYEYQMNGTTYSVKTEYFSDEFPNNVEVSVKGNDPNTAAIVREGVSNNMLLFFGLLFIFEIVFICVEIILIIKIIRLKNNNNIENV